MKQEEIIKKIDKIADDRVMFEVKNGYNKLLEGITRTEDNIQKKVILLDNVPLIELSGEDSPVCASIVRVLSGRDKVNIKIQDIVNINDHIKDVMDGLKKIKPILELLEDGEYELQETDMIPTDGENNDFWNSGMTGHYYNASADIYHKGKYIKGFPKFLVPSERIDGIDMERVEYYREKIRHGEELVGIALELRGFMAVLLDGHHKAVAAYLEGKNLKCLMIKSVKKSLNIPNISIEKCSFNNNIKVEIGIPKEVYPDFRAVAAIRKPIDISDKKIDNIFKLNSKQPIEELEEVVYYLTVYDKERAKKLCFDILRKSEFQVIWGLCLEYLSRYREEKVENLFRKILLDNNIKYAVNYMSNLGIVNRYFDKAVN